MSREIKFRAWTGEHLLSHDALVITFCRKSGRPCVYLDWRDIPDDDEVECEAVMQYTGLKDAEGQEIYEGDILEVKTLSGSSHALYVVDYNTDTGGYIMTHPEGGVYPLMDEAFEYRIISNIYENPELMEDD